jgi:hypothetical protein
MTPELRTAAVPVRPNEYTKLANLDVQPGEDQITLRLEPLPGSAFETSEIATCLDHTVSAVERR